MGRHQVVDLVLTYIPLHAEEIHRLRSGDSVRTSCSAENFVKFLIARCNAGFVNRFRDLKATIIFDTKDINDDLSLLKSIYKGLVVNNPPVSSDRWTKFPFDLFDIDHVGDGIKIRQKNPQMEFDLTDYDVQLDGKRLKLRKKNA